MVRGRAPAGRALPRRPYDVRGHGRSGAPKPLRGGFTLEKLTDDFLAVVDAVSPDRPVHLVGHDWGSVQAWEFVTVLRTESRIASFTSMSGPSLDHFGHWINRRLAAKVHADHGVLDVLETAYALSRFLPRTLRALARREPPL